MKTLLTTYKQMALKAGNLLKPFSIFVQETGLDKTDFQTGKIAEIVVAWMLGYFQSIKKDGLKVYINDTLDFAGIDFRLEKFGVRSDIQQKFNISEDNDRRVYNNNIVIFRCGPDKKVFTGTFFVKSMTGDTVLIDLLEQSGLYNLEELLDVFDNVEEFGNMLRLAWRFMKN